MTENKFLYVIKNFCVGMYFIYDYYNSDNLLIDNHIHDDLKNRMC